MYTLFSSVLKYPKYKSKVVGISAHNHSQELGTPDAGKNDNCVQMHKTQGKSMGRSQYNCVLKHSPRHFMLLQGTDFKTQCPFDPLLAIFQWERCICPQILTTRFIWHEKCDYFYIKHLGNLYWLQPSQQEISFPGAQLVPEFVETISSVLLHIQTGLSVVLFIVYCTRPLPE